MWLSLGGFHERGQDWLTTQRIYNCHVLLDPAGESPRPCPTDLGSPAPTDIPPSHPLVPR